MTPTPTIITCAVTGGGDTTSRNPAVPVTPSEIAASAVAAARAGAAIVHIHVRDPATKQQSTDLALYRETYHRIRDADPDVIVNLTTGPGGAFVPGDPDPRQAGPGTTLLPPADRVAHILELRPEMCSLDCGTMNFYERPYIALPRHLREMARLIRDAGVKPELEAFDAGHVRLACHLVTEGLVVGRPLFQLVLGVPWNAPASPEAMVFLHRLVPPAAIWAAFGISSSAFPMVAQAWLLGGHARVGLEDSLYMGHDVLAPNNAALVERARAIIESLGGAVASPSDARAILELDTSPS